MVTTTEFGGYGQFRLESGKLRVTVTELGATVTELVYHGRSVALGYPTAADYLAGGAYVGAIVGRYANRIAGGGFSLNGQRYALSRNEGENTLHGGADSWDKRRWSGEIVGNGVRFTLQSPDGDNGFPGNLTAQVSYTVTDGELRIDFEGMSDADTVYAPTTHLYFNLDGGDVRQHRMQIHAAAWLEVGEGLIPTGRLCPAVGDFDFSAPRPVGRAYDHCFVLHGEKACTAEAGGVSLTLLTDFPAVQFYTGEFLGEPFGAFGGFAIEPEFYPDSPDHPEFPTTVLKKGERFHKYAIYRFS